ncbi:MAG: radical SAM family heme chaperone HemW [Defluviitaleaceae bacterium]|nr:radical SAM family heme chaperone HemW [Defluviitaleaceae bacterium]
MHAAGVYVHVPFCVQKCIYCDFLSFSVGKNSAKNSAKNIYVAALLNEIKNARTNKLFAHGIDSVYIGGGTPTALPAPLLCEILRAVASLPLLPGAEFTVETNPGTHEYFAALKTHGVNRLSFGVQSTHDFLLRTLGRIHTKEDFIKNFRAARDAGFDNINVDLMFSLLGQTTAHWRETLAEITLLSPEHISAYSLTPAENTPLHEQLEAGAIHLPSDETDRDMYHTARRILAEAGYIHYEISNFAKPGRESRHNVNCWTMRPYIGFGLGAHSFDGNARWHNIEDMEQYISCHVLPLQTNRSIS